MFLCQQSFGHSSQCAAIPYRFTLLCYTALWRKQIHENAIEQIARMYQEKLFIDTPVLTKQAK